MKSHPPSRVAATITPLAQAPHLPTPLTPNVSHFDTLPNAANISIKAFAAVNGQGVSTLWRHCKQDPDFPRPIRLSPGCTRFNVGEIRAYLAKKAAASRLTQPVRPRTAKGAV